MPLIDILNTDIIDLEVQGTTKDEVLHYKQTERNALTPPDKPPVDNLGPET